MLLEWAHSPVAERVHNIAALVWLTGNATWMTAELLFDPKSGKNEAGEPLYPWHSGPLAGENDKAYWTGTHIAQFQFGFGLLLLSGFYASCLCFSWSTTARKESCNPQEEEETIDIPDETG